MNMMGRVSGRFIRCAALAALLMVGLGVAGCDPPDPNASTPTSGRLVVYVDELYAPIMRTLADSFMTKSPNAKIEVHVVPARTVIQELFNAAARDTALSDTGTTTAGIVGRMLLPDEQEAARTAGYDPKEYILAYDGLAVVVPVSSPLRQSTVERVRSVLGTAAPTASMLDSTAPADPIRFILPDQNSSALTGMQNLLSGDSNIVAPARYFSTLDSVLGPVAASEGLSILGWLAAHHDSTRLRTLPLGFTDSTGRLHPPAIIHPTSLVTGAYPLTIPVVGYTFASNRSVAAGFLAWLARGQDAQHYMGMQGMQPANVKIRIVLPDQPQ